MASYSIIPPANSKSGRPEPLASKSSVPPASSNSGRADSSAGNKRYLTDESLDKDHKVLQKALCETINSSQDLRRSPERHGDPL